MGDLSWRERGKCWGTRRADDGTPDPFFPNEPYAANRRPTKGDIRREAAAARLCEGCPVLEDCRDYATWRPQETGVWGGTLRRQRAVLRRQELRARRAEEAKRSA